MFQLIPQSRSLLREFAPAAARYWLGVFPAVNREVARWERLADSIPNPDLRTLALGALRHERGNLEGAAAFAAFIPSKHRHRVVRALVAFQAAYDYADALSEQPSPYPVANARRLHEALSAALGASGRDYYSHHPHRDDGGYLGALVERCAKAVCGLPSYSAVATLAQAATERMAIFQSLNLSERQGGRGALEGWVHDRRDYATAGLLWWETAAAAGSSLVVFALIAAAASPGVHERHVKSLTRAYFPWIGALHILLDSLADQAEDARSGVRSFLHYYDSPEHAASRLYAIAAGATRRAKALPGAIQHLLILAAMVSFYLSAADRGCPYVCRVQPLLLKAIGSLAAPAMLTMRLRRLRRNARRARAPGCDGAPHG